MVISLAKWISVRKALMGLGVNPPKNASESERKIAEEVAEWIDDIKDFEMFLFDAMDGVGHGYSCQEDRMASTG
jgi:phage gp29-like protein